MSRRIRARAGICLVVALIALAGCGQQTVKPIPAPTVVHDTVTKYVAVPAELTQHCAIYLRKSNKVKEVANGYNVRGEELAACNKQLDKIRDLGTQP